LRALDGHRGLPISAVCASCRRARRRYAMAQAPVRPHGAHRQLGAGFLQHSPGPRGGAGSAHRVL